MQLVVAGHPKGFEMTVAQMRFKIRETLRSRGLLLIDIYSDKDLQGAEWIVKECGRQ